MRLSTKLTIAMSLVAGISSVSVRSAAADQLGFAVDAIGSLYTVDLTTATAAPIGATGQLLEGLAISPQGSLFGTDFLGNIFGQQDHRRGDADRQYRRGRHRGPDLQGHNPDRHRLQ
jgi:hypothetical protein